MRNDGYDRHGRDHKPDRQHSDGTGVRAQVPQRGEESGGVEQRRKDGDEDDVRRQLKRRDSGHEAESQSSEHQEDGYGMRSSGAITSMAATASSKPTRSSCSWTPKCIPGA